MKFSPYYTEEVRKLNLFNLKCSSFSRLYVFLNFFIKHIFKDFIYLFERERREHKWCRRGEGEGEVDYLLSREPDAGLDPRTLRP